MKKRKNCSKVIFQIVVVTLILMASSFTVLTVRSQSAAECLMSQELYKDTEKEFRSRVNEILNESHCSYSGINMTRIVEVSGERNYTLLIHNHYFEFLEEAQMTDLKEKLVQLSAEYQQKLGGSISFQYSSEKI